MSDVMHGPKVRLGRSRRKTYLIAFIDDATRVVPFAAFATAENIQAFLPTFKNALIRRGLPQRLYVDNGAAYRSRQLVLICAKLGMGPCPAGKGKIERFFRTLRAGWLNHLDPQALDRTLNRSWAGSRASITTPPIAASRGSRSSNGQIRPLAEATLTSTSFEARRLVHKDRTGTAPLRGRAFRQKLILAYDPDAPPSGPSMSHDGKPAGKATRLDAYANTAVKRGYPSRQVEADGRAPSEPSPLACESSTDVPATSPSPACPSRPRAGIQRPPRGRGQGRSSCAASACSPRWAPARQPSAATSPPSSTRGCTASTTSPSPRATCSVQIESHGRSASRRGAAHHAIRTEISRQSFWRPSNWSSSSTRPTTCATTLEDLRLLTRHGFGGACASSSSASPSSGGLVRTSPSASASSSDTISPASRDEGRRKPASAPCELPRSVRRAPGAWQINRIAHYALSAAALDKARTVNAEHLQHALDELRP